MIETLSQYVKTIEGPPPKILHVELDFQPYRRPDASQSGTVEHLSSWNGQQTIVLKVGATEFYATYTISSVVYCDYTHWVAVHFDRNGSKWTYDSDANEGCLMYQNDLPYSRGESSFF